VNLGCLSTPAFATGALRWGWDLPDLLLSPCLPSSNFVPTFAKRHLIKALAEQDLSAKNPATSCLLMHTSVSTRFWTQPRSARLGEGTITKFLCQGFKLRTRRGKAKALALPNLTRSTEV